MLNNLKKHIKKIVKMKRLVIKVSFALLFLMPAASMFAQKYIYDVHRTEYHDDMLFYDVRRIIRLPSVNGLIPVKCDFHIHTVFSDGDLWPTATVREAWQDGLDAIAITDHTTAEPYKSNVIGGPNSSYEIAKPQAERMGMILIQGTEITRSKIDGGHLNALFINDASKTLDVSTEEAVKESVRQGGVVIWNHPGWAIDSCAMFDVNKRLIESGHIHAVEVFNEAEWYPRALSWCRDFNLAPTAATDIHYVTNSFYRISEKVIRPMTIVMAREKTPEGIKQALLERKTIAFFRGMLAGNSQMLNDFFLASVSVEKVSTITNSRGQQTNYYVFKNSYDVPFVFVLENGRKMTLHPNSQVIIDRPAAVRELKVNIVNLHTYEYETLEVSIALP